MKLRTPFPGADAAPTPPAYDVVIAGGGPVGLTLAAELRLGGASVLVLERDAEPDAALTSGFMGARSINAISADAFWRRGILETVKQAALWWFDPATTPRDAVPVHIGHFAGLPLRSDLIDLDDPDLAANAHGGGAISLLALRDLLADRAERLGAAILRGAAVTGFEQDAHQVAVEFTGSDAITGGGVNGTSADDIEAIGAGRYRVRGRYLAGCDGGRSTVRRLAGIEFPGTDAEFIGRQALVTFADPELAGERLPVGDWIRTDGGAYTHGPVPGRVHTVEYGNVPGRTEPQLPLTAEEMTASLNRVLDSPNDKAVRIAQVLTGTRYTDATRQAATYRAGRILLAGDAAHIHSPAGGQGLNLGIGDAMGLGWRLAATVNGHAAPRLLDGYTAERHPVGAWVQGWSDAQTALGRPGTRSAALRAVVGDLQDTTPGATYVLKHISGLARRVAPQGGRDHPLVGRTVAVADERHPHRAVLCTDDPELRTAAAGCADVLTFAPAREELPASVLVRPDGVVAWAADGSSTARETELTDALRRLFAVAG